MNTTNPWNYVGQVPVWVLVVTAVKCTRTCVSVPYLTFQSEAIAHQRLPPRLGA
jgi:hypothetical protein